MTDKKRLFLAANLSVATTRKIAEAVERMKRLAQGKMRAVWVPPTNLHVTLKFLGWARAEVVTAIADAMGEAVRGRKAFDVVARGVGAFPNPRAARVLWVGLDDPTGGLAALARDAEDRMEALGFPREGRPFSAHVTVARVKEGGGAEEVLAPARDAEFGRSLIRDVVLYESVMKSTGSEYRVVARMPLAAPAGRAERQTQVVDPETAQDSEEPEPDGGQQPA